ncbi:MAG: cell surface protein [Kiritimatiellia bacterium]
MKRTSHPLLTTLLLLGARASVAEPHPGPQSLAVSPDGKTLYVAAMTAKQVLFVDAEKAAVTRKTDLPAAPSGLVLSPDGARLAVACPAPASTIQLLDTGSGAVVASISAGHTATAPVISPDGKTLYACYRFDGAVGVIDLAAGKETARIKTAREPISAALTPDGKFLYVAHHMHDGRSDVDLVAATVSVIDTAAGKVVKQLVLPNGSTLLRDIRISPDGKYAAVVHTLARFQLPTTQLERGWMNTSAVTLIDTARQEILNSVLLDDVDRGAANPWGVAWTPDGAKLLVTHAGTHELSVIDLPGVLAKLQKADAANVPNDLAFLVQLRQRIPLGGNGPRAVALTGTRAWTANFFTDDLSVVDLAGTPMTATRVALGPAVPDSVERQGERWFNDAMICFQNWQSCASCHSEDARVDGLNWDLLNDGIGNPKNNRSMLLAHKTPPAMSLAIRDTAEVAVRAGIRFIEFTVQPPEVADAMDAYLKALTPVPSPALVDGKLSEAARRGQALFETSGCADCHPPPLYTDMKQYDLGTTAGMDKGRSVDTPTLIEAWRTAPYLHDGSKATLEELLGPGRHGQMNDPIKEQDLKDVIEFVRSL